jgi:RNA polymerase sigma-70 factor (family 1)
MSHSSYSDEDLLEAIRHDDEEAFAEIFSRYWDRVYHMTYPKVRSEAVTQEIVQDLFVTIWEKRRSLAIKNLESYFYASVRNRALNYIESQLVRRRYWIYYRRYLPTTVESTANTVELNELEEMVKVGISNLPEKSQLIFKLSRLEGRTISEIADALNLSEKAIQYHLTQSLKKLRVHLKDFIVIIALFRTFMSRSEDRS